MWRKERINTVGGYGADDRGVGVIIGPILGGLLSDPVSSYPSVFGENSLFGGENGVFWLKHVRHHSDLLPLSFPPSPSFYSLDIVYCPYFCLQRETLTSKYVSGLMLSRIL